MSGLRNCFNTILLVPNPGKFSVFKFAIYWTIFENITKEITSCVVRLRVFNLNVFLRHWHYADTSGQFQKRGIRGPFCVLTHFRLNPPNIGYYQIVRQLNVIFQCGASYCKYFRITLYEIEVDY